MSDRTRELECVISDLKQQVRDTEKVRDDLIEVLQAIISDGLHCDVVPHLHEKARAAIAKATGDRP